MKKDIIKLNMKTSDKGSLYVYRALDDSECEFDVEVEFDGSPAQKKTMTDPAFDAECEITSVTNDSIGSD